MVCNEVQWSATSCNNRAKRIVLSTKKALVVGGESRSQLFLQKKITNSQTLSQTPLYTIYECLILKNKDNARKNFII